MLLTRGLKLGLLAAIASSLMWGDALTGNLFYTTFTGTNRVFEVGFNFNGVSFTLGPSKVLTGIPPLAGADGLEFAPDGNLLVGEQHNAVAEITTAGAFVKSVTPGSNAFSLALSSGKPNATLYTLCNGGCGSHAIAAVTLSGGGLSTNGVQFTVSGDDTDIRGIAFDPLNDTWYYGAAGDSALGDFGTITIDDTTHTAVTHKLLGGQPAHFVWFDPFTGDIIMNGSNSIAQYSPTSNTIVSKLSAVGPFDNATTDGHGHLFVASNSQLLFVDYDATGLIGSAGNFKNEQFLAKSLDDIAPLGPPIPKVPEPKSIMLLGGAFLILAGGAKKRMRQRTKAGV